MLLSLFWDWFYKQTYHKSENCPKDNIMKSHDKCIIQWIVANSIFFDVAEEDE